MSSFHVYCEMFVEVLFCECGKRLRRQVTSVVHEKVQSPKGFQRFVEQSCNFRDVPDVGLNGNRFAASLPNDVHDFFCFPWITCEIHNDLRTLQGQFLSFFSLLRLIKLMIQLHQRPLLDPRHIAPRDAQLLRNLPLRALFATSFETEAADDDSFSRSSKISRF